MSPTTREKYLFDSGSDPGKRQLGFLASLLDPVTTTFLRTIGIRPGMRCLDLGAGSGSITGWLAHHVMPSGRVTAVDLDVSNIVEWPNVDIYRQDINDDLPAAGPFDLIHARLLLMHLPERESILRRLVDALAPGGWLVLGEFSARHRRVLAAPGQDDEDLFYRVHDIAHHVVTPRAGVSWQWAHQVDGAMAGADLADIRGIEHSTTATGGSDEALLNLNYVEQTRPHLLGAGLTERDLLRFAELMHDPTFRAWFYQFVCTAGRKIPG